MKKSLNYLEKRIGWTTILIIIMTVASAYTLLDAFVIPKSYVVVAPAQIENPTTTPDAADLQENAALPELKTVDLDTAEIQENTGLTALNSVELDESDELDETEIQEPVDLIESNTIDEVETIAEDTVSEAEIEVIITDDAYRDAHINISIETVEENGVVFYVANIQLADVSYLKTAFANNTFGRNVTQATSEMAEANNAIFAINGDYYGFRDTGLIIRNGVLYRDIPENSLSNQALTIDSAGNFAIVDNNQASGTLLIEEGILQSFSFGPTLVLDGQVMATNDTTISQDENPRTAIGQISPLHYIFIVVDGRSDASDGMTLQQLAQEFVNRGAEVAYNLDGGGSSAMWFNGNLVNNPTSGRRDGERDISDIIYIGY